MTDIAAFVEAAVAKLPANVIDDARQEAWVAALEAVAAGRDVEAVIAAAVAKARRAARFSDHAQLTNSEILAEPDESPGLARVTDADRAAAESLPAAAVEALRSIILDGVAPRVAAATVGMRQADLRDLLRDAGVSTDGRQARKHARGLLAAHAIGATVVQAAGRRWTPKMLGKAWGMSFEGALARVVEWHRTDAVVIAGGVTDTAAVAMTMLGEIERITGRAVRDWPHLLEATLNHERARVYVQPDGSLTWWRRADRPGRPTRRSERVQFCVALPELRRRARATLSRVAGANVALPAWSASSAPEATRKGPKPRGVTARVLARVEYDADGCMTWPGQMIEGIPYVWAGDREARYRQVRAVVAEAGGWTPAGGRPRCGKARCVDRRCCSAEAGERAA